MEHAARTTLLVHREQCLDSLVMFVAGSESVEFVLFNCVTVKFFLLAERCFTKFNEKVPEAYGASSSSVHAREAQWSRYPETLCRNREVCICVDTFSNVHELTS